ncbi:MAG TPA: ubiquitin-like domain-containing protein, partial [Anaerolineaceae bacterium]
MTKTVLKWLPAGLAAAGLILIAAWLYRPVQIIVDGQPRQVSALALSPGVVLREAGLAIRPGDRVEPALGAFLPNLERIRIRSARSVQVWDGTRLVSLETSERIPANILLALGIRLFPDDLVLSAGQALTASETLPDGTAAVLQVQPAQKITLQTGGETQ